MQASCDFSKPWWGDSQSDDGTLHLCFCPLGRGGQWTLCRGSGSGLWPPYAVGHAKSSPQLSALLLTVTLLPGVGRFCGLLCLGGHYFHPVWGCNVAKNFCICKCNQQFHGFPKFSHTLCQLVWFSWHWWSGLLSPMYQVFGISQGFLWLFHVVVLAIKLHVI